MAPTTSIGCKLKLSDQMFKRSLYGTSYLMPLIKLPFCSHEYQRCCSIRVIHVLLMRVRVYFLPVLLRLECHLWVGVLLRLFDSLGVVIDGKSVLCRLVMWRSVLSKLCITFWVRLVTPSNYVNLCPKCT